MHVYISTYHYSILSDSWVTQSTSYPGPFSVRPKRRGWGRVCDTVWSSSPWKIRATPLLFVFIGLSYDVTEDVKSQKGLVTSLYWYRGWKNQPRSQGPLSFFLAEGGGGGGEGTMLGCKNPLADNNRSNTVTWSVRGNWNKATKTFCLKNVVGKLSLEWRG